MTEDEMVGWHHRLDGHEFEQAPGVGDGQGSLACCSPWRRQESDTTERLNSSNTRFQAVSRKDRTHVSHVSCVGRQALYHQHHPGSPLCVYVQISSPCTGFWPTLILYKLIKFPSAKTYFQIKPHSEVQG